MSTCSERRLGGPVWIRYEVVEKIRCVAQLSLMRVADISTFAKYSNSDNQLNAISL